MQKGDLVPHFTVSTIDGDTVRYETSYWQRRNLVLVSTAGQPAADYVKDLTACVPDVDALSAGLVVTPDRVGPDDGPLLVVADQWGEIVDVQRAARVDDLPGGAEVRRWLEYLEIRCPECEGEAK